MGRGDATVYIGIGSNINPEHNIPRAIVLLSRHIAITKVSTLYRTQPIERPEQPTFVNGVIGAISSLPARQLKYQVLRGIESALGRTRSPDKYAPRTIDLDILLYGDSVITETGIKIPDPALRKRSFVCVPLLELDTEIRLPDTGELLRDLCLELRDVDMLPATELTHLCKKEITGEHRTCGRTDS